MKHEMAAQLRVIELHRSVEGGWDSVDAGSKALATAAGGSAASTLPPPPPCRLKPLAELFAECLQQDPLLGAAFVTGAAV